MIRKLFLNSRASRSSEVMGLRKCEGGVVWRFVGLGGGGGRFC